MRLATLLLVVVLGGCSGPAALSPEEFMRAEARRQAMADSLLRRAPDSLAATTASGALAPDSSAGRHRAPADVAVRTVAGSAALAAGIALVLTAVLILTGSTDGRILSD